MTGRLWRLVRFEWQKLLARRFALVAVLVVALIAALTPWAGHVVAEAQRLSSGGGRSGSAQDFENGWTAFASGLDWGLKIATYLVLLFAASSIAEESQLGTLKTLLVRPVKRGELLVAKWLALSGYAVALLLAITAAAALAGQLQLGYGTVIDKATGYEFTTAPAMLGFAVRGVALVVPSLCALVGLGLLFSAAIDHPGYAVGAAISCYFVLDAVAELSRRAQRFLLPHYTRLSVGYLGDIAAAYQEKRHFLEETPLMVAVPLASVAVFLFGAFVLLRSREIGE